jgi:hypothetical protein
VSDEYLGMYLSERADANFDVRHNLSTAITYAIPTLRAGRVLTPLLRDWSIDGVIHAQSGMPIAVVGSDYVENGAFFYGRPDRVDGVPLYLKDPSVPGGRRFNPAAFAAPPINPTYPRLQARQGTLPRNALRELAIYQTDLALARTIVLTGELKVQVKAEAFNVFNHPMFGTYGRSSTAPSTLGVPTTTLSRGLPGLSQLYQLGGPRSIQLSVRVTF